MRLRTLALLSCIAVAGCGQSVEPDSPAGAESPTGLPPSGDGADLLSGTLPVAVPQVIALPADPDSSDRPLSASLDAWRGALSHLAGTAHYDRGEWIYEDYPWTAYGAALPGTAPLYGALDLLGGLHHPSQRIPGALAFAIPQAGAGPLADEADLLELRMAVRGEQLHVMLRTTTMHAPVRTALLLMFDTGRSGASLAIPFGSGLTTSGADTAALVTADGTRLVDLLSGATSDLPALANPEGYINLLTTRIPLASVARDAGAQLRFVAATGLASPGSFELISAGLAGPVAKAVPRFDEPVQSTYDRLQALALSKRDIDRFMVTLSLDRMRAGDTERLLPGIGYSVRTFLAAEAHSNESGTDGILRQYGLFVPGNHSGAPAPATLLLRGSSMSAHGLAAITPGIFQNLGDDDGAIVISPCGRSGFDLFQGPVYLEVMQTIEDAKALLPIDSERLTVAGYSMGGYATYMFATTQPDLFAGAFAIAGPVGGLQPATSTYGFPDVIPQLGNLLHTPVQIFHGDIDVNVPISNALAAVQRLRSLGFRYRFNILPANTHFSQGIQNDYSIGARHLRAAQRVSQPARVLYSRSMAYERAVDTAEMTDLPGAGTPVGLVFDKAWFVQDLQAADPVGGVASVDVRTFARASPAVTPVITAGVDTGPLVGQPLSPFEEQSWQLGADPEIPRNALSALLTGVAAVSLDLGGMALSADEALTAAVRTDTPVVVTLRHPDASCLRAAGPLQGRAFVGGLELSLPPGEHAIELIPCPAG